MPGETGQVICRYIVFWGCVVFGGVFWETGVFWENYLVQFEVWEPGRKVCTGHD